MTSDGDPVFSAATDTNTDVDDIQSMRDDSTYGEGDREDTATMHSDLREAGVLYDDLMAGSISGSQICSSDVLQSWKQQNILCLIPKLQSCGCSIWTW